MLAAALWKSSLTPDQGAFNFMLQALTGQHVATMSRNHLDQASEVIKAAKATQKVLAHMAAKDRSIRLPCGGTQSVC
jgi:hypothetical protein